MSQLLNAIFPTVLKEAYSGGSSRQPKAVNADANLGGERMSLVTSSIEEINKAQSTLDEAEEQRCSAMRINSNKIKHGNISVLNDNSNSTVTNCFLCFPSSELQVKNSVSIKAPESQTNSCFVSINCSSTKLCPLQSDKLCMESLKSTESITTVAATSIREDMQLNEEEFYLDNSSLKAITQDHFSVSDMRGSVMENAQDANESPYLNSASEVNSSGFSNVAVSCFESNNIKNYNCTQSNAISLKCCKNDDILLICQPHESNDFLYNNKILSVCTTPCNEQDLLKLVPLLIRYLFSFLVCSFLNEEEVKMIKGIRKCTTQYQAMRINIELALKNYERGDIYLLPTDSALHEFIKELETFYTSYYSVSNRSLPYDISQNALLASIHDAHTALRTLVHARESSLMSWLNLIKNEATKNETDQSAIDATIFLKNDCLEKVYKEKNREDINSGTVFIPPPIPWKIKLHQITKKNEICEQEHTKLRNQIHSLQYDLQQERQLRQKELLQIVNQNKGTLKNQETRAMRERQNLRKERNFLRTELAKIQKALEDIYTRPEEHFLDLFEKIAQKLKNESDAVKKNNGLQALLLLQREGAWDLLFPFSRNKSETASIGFTFGVPFRPKTSHSVPAMGYEKPCKEFLPEPVLLRNSKEPANRITQTIDDETKNKLQKLQPSPPLRISYLCKRHLQMQHEQMKSKINALEDTIQDKNDKIAKRDKKIEILQNENASIKEKYSSKLSVAISRLKAVSKELTKVKQNEMLRVRASIENKEEKIKSCNNAYCAGEFECQVEEKERQYTAEFTTLITSNTRLQQQNAQLFEQNQYFRRLLQRRNITDLPLPFTKSYDFSLSTPSSLAASDARCFPHFSPSSLLLFNNGCRLTTPPPSTSYYDSFRSTDVSDMPSTVSAENERDFFNQLHGGGRKPKLHINFENDKLNNSNLYNLPYCPRNIRNEETEWQREYEKCNNLKEGRSVVCLQNEINQCLSSKSSMESLLAIGEKERNASPTKSVLHSQLMGNQKQSDNFLQKQETLSPIPEIIKKKKSMKFAQRSATSNNTNEKQNSCRLSNSQNTNYLAPVLILDELSSELSDLSQESSFYDNEFEIRESQRKTTPHLKLENGKQEEAKFCFNLCKENEINTSKAAKDNTKKHKNRLVTKYSMDDVIREESNNDTSAVYQGKLSLIDNSISNSSNSADDYFSYANIRKYCEKDDQINFEVDSNATALNRDFTGSITSACQSVQNDHVNGRNTAKKMCNNKNFMLFQNGVNYSSSKYVSNKEEKRNLNERSYILPHSSVQSRDISLPSTHTFISKRDVERDEDEITRRVDPTGSSCCSLSTRETPNGSTCSCISMNPIVSTPRLRKEDRNIMPSGPNIHLDLRGVVLSSTGKTSNGDRICNTYAPLETSLSWRGIGSKVDKTMPAINEGSKNGFYDKSNIYNSNNDIAKVMQKVHPICTSRRHYTSSVMEDKYHVGDAAINNSFFFSDSPALPHKFTSGEFPKNRQTTTPVSTNTTSKVNKDFQYHPHGTNNTGAKVYKNADNHEGVSSFYKFQHPSNDLIYSSNYCYKPAYFQTKSGLLHEVDCRSPHHQSSIEERLLPTAAEHDNAIYGNMKISSRKVMCDNINPYCYPLLSNCSNDINVHPEHHSPPLYSSYTGSYRAPIATRLDDQSSRITSTMPLSYSCYRLPHNTQMHNCLNEYASLSSQRHQNVKKVANGELFPETLGIHPSLFPSAMHVTCQTNHSNGLINTPRRYATSSLKASEALSCSYNNDSYNQPQFSLINSESYYLNNKLQQDTFSQHIEFSPDKFSIPISKKENDNDNEFYIQNCNNIERKSTNSCMNSTQ